MVAARLYSFIARYSGLRCRTLFARSTRTRAFDHDLPPNSMPPALSKQKLLTHLSSEAFATTTSKKHARPSSRGYKLWLASSREASRILPSTRYSLYTISDALQANRRFYTTSL